MQQFKAPENRSTVPTGLRLCIVQFGGYIPMTDPMFFSAIFSQMDGCFFFFNGKRR